MEMGGVGMFGFVTACIGELSKEQRSRYGGIYCGICRQMKYRASQSARLTLSYDMVFLSLLLMSLYEPEEEQGVLHCAVHPLRRLNWIDNEYVRYAADMNTALAYYNLMDDWQDDRKPAAKAGADLLARRYEAVKERWPVQTVKK